MFWILGASAFRKAFLDLPKNRVNEFLADQLEHVRWEGCHFEDFIFPLFVFVVGVSIVLTLPAKVAQRGHARTIGRVARRAAVLFLLGIWYSGGASHDLAHVRWLGVLQRIAIAYFFGSCLFLWLKPRGLMMTIAALLLGYWALLACVPVPEYGAGDYAEGHNLTNYLDKMYLPGRKYDRDHDPEGLLSSLPAIATCLFGVLAGLWLRRPGKGAGKALAFMGAGAVLVCLGLAWGEQLPHGWNFLPPGWSFPVIKKIWTSSYVVLVAGWSAIMLGLFYLVIDVWRLKRWAIPLVWIGMNPITLYLIDNIASSRMLATRIVGGDTYDVLNLLYMPGSGDLLLAVVATTFSLWLAWFLHNRLIFLRV